MEPETAAYFAMRTHLHEHRRLHSIATWAAVVVAAPFVALAGVVVGPIIGLALLRDEIGERIGEAIAGEVSRRAYDDAMSVKNGTGKAGR